MYLIKLTCVLFILVITNTSYAIDNIKMHKPILGEDKRSLYKDEVIQRALAISESNFGPFTLEFINIDMTTMRALHSLKVDKMINVFIAAASTEWDRVATPIRIPIRFGQLSYRLLLINKSNLEKFALVNSFDDFKNLIAGLQQGWTINNILHKSNIETVIGNNFEGLFLMLNKNRFDYFPRAIYEAYNELDDRINTLENIVVEPTLALYIPMVSYIYVSTDELTIIKRLEYGLQTMLENGELKNLFNKYYKEDVERANLKDRKIIIINNPYFDEQGLVENKLLPIPVTIQDAGFSGN